MIVMAAIRVGLYAAAVAAVAYLRVSAEEKRDDFVAFRMSQVGVTYESGSGDYAEWMPMADPLEPLLPGYIVAVNQGKITKNTERFDKLFVVSTKPIVLGNAPEEDKKKNYEKVAFMGQVPVYVTGQVNAGDYILPSGRNDGFGRAVSPPNMQAEDYAKMVGVAWSSSGKESSLVNVGIGLNAGDLGAEVIEQDRLIQELESSFNESNTALARLIPRYKKAAKAAGIFENEESAKPSNLNMAEANASFNKLLGSNNNELNYFNISDEQILTMTDLAFKSLPRDKGNKEVDDLLSMIKNDPEFKTQFIKEIRVRYLDEIHKEFEKWKPRQ